MNEDIDIVRGVGDEGVVKSQVPTTDRLAPPPSPTTTKADDKK